MAKDPAFLFYPGDWNLGTMHFTILEKGAYLELLILQFSVGKFTEAQAKHMLRDSFCLAWANVKQKFKTDGNFYWNERLIIEQEKRKKFTDSRRINGLQAKTNKKSSLKTNKHMLKHMEDENENENTIVNKDENENKREKIKRIFMPFGEKFSETWQEWKLYKLKQHEFKYKSDGTEQAALHSLTSLANDEKTCIAIIHQSMANGWKGFFTLKNNGNGHATNKPTLREEVQAEFTKRYGNGKQTGN